MVKALHIVSVIVVILIVAMGVVFLFWDEILQMSDNEELLESDSNPESAKEVGGIDGEDSEEVIADVDGTRGIESSNTDGEDSEEVAEETNCKMQQIQYSLKNFKNNVKCTNMGADGCIRLIVNCSMEIYNLDRDADGIFGIRYSLVDSNDEELDFELVQKNTRFDVPEIFSAEFIRNDMSGLDEDLTCPFTMETIPTKEVCS